MQHLYKTIICTCCGESIRVPVYCKNRFCDVCSPARQYRMREKIKFLLKAVKYPPGYFLGMVTVSLPNTPDLGEGIRKLQKSFRKLRSTKQWKSRVRGGLYVIEITGRPGSWHPHIHALVEQKFLSWKTFKDLWNRISGGSAFHVKKIPSGKAERYITKYIAKPDAAPAELKDLARQVAHLRLFQPFGAWHGQLGGFVKAKYPCPKCGETFWLPLDVFLAESERWPVQPRASPVGPNGRQRPRSGAAAADVSCLKMFDLPPSRRFDLSLFDANCPV